MKSGTIIGLILIACGVFAGVAIFVLQGIVYYHRAEPLTQIRVGERDFAVSGYQGLENPTLPLRLRGCFQISEPEAALSSGAAVAEISPFGAPFWFGCWDAEKIDADLASGAAQAVVAERLVQGEFVFERIVVIYPSGEAYQWRRLVQDG